MPWLFPPEFPPMSGATMSASPARRPALSLRTLGAVAALALVAVGVTPLAAGAAGELVGGGTPGAAVPVPLTELTGGSFRASNVGVTSGSYAFGAFRDVAWYSYTPASSGLLDVSFVGDGPSHGHDATLELWRVTTGGGRAVVAWNDDGLGYPNPLLADVTVTAGTTYLIGLGAVFGGHGNGLMTVALQPPPTAPVGVTATPGGELVDVTWGPPAETYGALTGYEVWYRTSPDGAWASTSAPASATTATVTGLAGLQPYEVRVLARNAAGASPLSEPAFATPLFAPVITLTTLPSPPTNRDPYWLVVSVRGGAFPALGAVSLDVAGVARGPVALDAGGVARLPAVGRPAGTYPVTVTYHGGPFGRVAPGEATSSVVIPKDPQVVDFTFGGTHEYGTQADVGATASSALPVAFATGTPGVCTVDGTVVSFVGVGDCTVTASQAGTAEIEAAATSQTVSVVPAPQAITLELPALVFGQPPVPVTATATSGLLVALAASGACTVGEGVLAVAAAGPCTVTAAQSGSDLFTPAVPVSVTVEVARRPQVVTLSALPALVEGVVALPVAGASDVGLPVTVATSGACLLLDGVLHTVAAGTCLVTATQPGDATTLPATAAASVLVTAGSSALRVHLRGAVGDDAGDVTGVVSGTGLRPGTAVSLTVHSAPTQIGLATVGLDGRVSIAEAFPADLAEGTHRAVARGVLLDGTTIERAVAFGVAADGSISWVGTAPALPRTGTDPLSAGLLAGLWVLVGVGLVLSRRVVLRRRPAVART